MRLAAAILAASVLVSCANKKLTVPSSAPIDSGIHSATSNVASARKYNDLAVVHNANALTAVQRIEAKAAVIKKYWHKPPQPPPPQ